MHVFYAPGLALSENILTAEESHHAVKVLRLRAGDEIVVADGKGLTAKAALTVPDSRSVMFEVIGEVSMQPARPFHLHIAIAPTKNIDRLEWFLEKATECGVDSITPIICENSERVNLKPERLEKILLSAMKQSLRAHLPVLHPMTKIKEVLSAPFEGQKFIPHCGDGLRQSFKETYKTGGGALVLIGPEGDFSASEIKIALENNFVPVVMGNYRLRTETAALTACMQLNFLNDLL
jgi:16S rRNA (uracil1498-N3)-methyltransferase